MPPVLHPATGPRARRGVPKDILDYALFLPSLWLICGLGYFFRLGGLQLVLAVMALYIGYAVLRLSSPPKWLAAYTIVCIVAAILSHYRVFPTSWQVHFNETAIARQVAPVIIFFVTAWTSKAYFERRLPAGDAFWGGGPVLFLSLVVAQIILFQQDFQYEGDPPLESMLTMYGSFTTNIIIAMFFLTAGAFAATGWRRGICIALILMMLAATSLAQFWVITAGILVVLLGAPGRLVATGLILTLLSLYVVGFFFIPELMNITPNSGIRLAFIVDTFKSVLDTFGVGVGYGTESVRWRYNFPGRPEFVFLPEPFMMTPDEMLEALSTGVHNSLIQALMRTGLLGFVLLVAAFLAVFPRADLPRRLRNHASMSFALIFIACFVNPALESPVQGMGVGFVYGYLIALRALGSSRAPGSARGIQPAA